MKMNKLMLAVIMAMGVVSIGANAADGGVGKIIFHGNILDAPCSIAPGANGSEQNVELGQVASSQLSNQGTSSPKNFEIQLVNCEVGALGKTVSITFGGSTAGNTGADANLLGITGTAKGAGVAVTDGSSNQIVLGKKTALRKLIDGDNTLNFSAYLQGLAASSAVVPGEYSSVADFTIDYE
ncbi:fimbrial protein [Serratia sp. UGAL515B_01]|uniref:fimbrial protein n=1 Tax=Serratia sp. UGAL515B_01 TaxID=2986763 RepID=UPI002955ACA8|nr:fimbrial protein [Serratia sp. UGAL515B_01]WON78392.1 type 1 fimbrial protein [Serratia sp. UGAL515B_01]